MVEGLSGNYKQDKQRKPYRRWWRSESSPVSEPVKKQIL
jgi:hypothetical protein